MLTINYSQRRKLLNHSNHGFCVSGIRAVSMVSTWIKASRFSSRFSIPIAY